MSTPSNAEMLMTRLARFKRLRELGAPSDVVEVDRSHALLAWAAHLADHGTPPAFPSELAAVASELGLSGAPARWWRGGLEQIGSGPSALAPSDPYAKVQLDAGYEVTDFAGLFSGEGMFLAGKLAGATILSPPPVVSKQSPMCILSRTLCTFDPFDHAFFDRTIQALDRQVQGGYADVYVAHWPDSPAAALIHFKSARVVAWAPARPNAERNPMPVPPMLPMSAVRFGVGVADLRELEEAMDVERLKAQLASLAGTPVAGSPLLREAIATRTPLSVLQIRDNGTKRIPYSVVNEVLGVRGEGPVTSQWGLAEDGAVAALAIDFGHLRLHSSRANRPSMPAILLSPRSLGARLRTADPSLSQAESERRGGQLAGKLYWLREKGETSKLVEALAALPGYERLVDDYFEA